MRLLNRSCLGASIVVLFCLPDAAAAQRGVASHPPYRWEKEIMVAMRDGIRLSTDVLLPRDAAGRLPTVLVRTPYDKDRVEWPIQKQHLEKFLAKGYSVVLQSERGHWFSEGVFENYLSGATGWWSHRRATSAMLQITELLRRPCVTPNIRSPA